MDMSRVNNASGTDRRQAITSQRTGVVVSGNDIQTEPNLTSPFPGIFERLVMHILADFVFSRNGNTQERVKRQSLCWLEILCNKKSASFVA